MAKATTKALTKTEIYNSIAETTGLSKKDIAGVFDALGSLIEGELNKGKKTDAKQFTIPGLCKIVTQYKPATKERPGKNPFTGEDIMLKAKPACNVVKIRPLKALKDMV